MRIVIFGTGMYFNKYIDSIKEDIEIVGIIDNDSSKMGVKLKGVCIQRPEAIREMVYDAVFLLSNYSAEMRKQLRNLDVDERKIHDIDQIARFFNHVEVKYYGDIKKRDNKWRIVVFSIALNSTGANNALFQLITLLKNHGYDVTVVAHLGGEILDKLTALDVSIVLTNAFSFDSAVFSELIHSADRIIVNTIWMYQLAYELIDHTCDFIWWIHETSGLDTMSSEYINTILTSNYSSIWFVSNTIKNMYEDYCAKSIESEIVPFGIEEKKASTISFTDDYVTFACIGHIGWGKGQDIFVKAASMIPEELKNSSKFYVVGAGKLDEDTEMLVNKSSNIYIKGEIQYEKMDEIYNSIDAIACCSREEGMSSVVVEASMYKRLSIITDIAGIIEYVEDRSNAIVFRSEDVRELSEMMAWVITHRAESKQIAEEAFNIYRNSFSMDVFEKRVIELI